MQALNLEWSSFAATCSNVVQKRHFCTTHQLNMASGSMLIAGSPSHKSGWLLSGFFNMSHLLRNPGYFDDLINQVRPIILLKLRLIRGPPPETRNSAMLHMLGVLPGDAHELALLFNGNLSNLQAVEHYCAAPELINKSELASEMARLITQNFYRSNV